MEVSLWAIPLEDNIAPHLVIFRVSAHSFHIRVLESNIYGLLLPLFFDLPGTLMLNGAVPYSTRNPNVFRSVASGKKLWPVLEKLTLDLGLESETNLMLYSEGTSQLPFWSAPRLKRVILKSFDEDLFLLPFLQYQFFTPRRARFILKEATKLSKLAITISDGNNFTSVMHGRFRPLLQSPEGPGSEVLTHSHLEDLRLQDVVLDPELHPTIFLQNSQLPALKSLVYSLETVYPRPLPAYLDYFPDTFDHPLLLFLGSQSHPMLITSFTISIGSMSTRGLVECLKLMPLLEVLRLTTRDELRGSRVPVVCDNFFLSMFLPEEPRLAPGHEATTESEGKDSTAPVEDTCDLPATGLCPLVHCFAVEAAEFTFADMSWFLSSRISLSEAQPTPYSRL
ncbi:hypothetical protein NMY22_g18705 [Coprinellus aureogranulatus]|nr:hypothetical protein NMY22_g18705 [Coprinellus aureogranulatus]